MSEITRSRATRERAERAVEKPAPWGDDIDLGAYSQTAEDHPYQEDPSRLPSETKGRMLEAGVILDDSSNRAATFLQVDHSVIHSKALEEGVEVMSSLRALERYPWLGEYWWQAVAVDADKFTAHTELDQNHGYFIRASPGAKVAQPLQACLYIAQHGLAQKVHNLIIAEEGSELHIVTGCTTAPMDNRGLHIGVSEFYVRRGAKLTFTMIHNWAPQMAVRPRTGVIVEEDGIFLSNYICLRPVRSLQMYPTARCIGENGLVRFNSVLVAPQGTGMDVGARVILAARGARAEIVSRAITAGGTIIARGHLVGEVGDVRGHLECRGLILAEQGKIHAVPELEGLVAGVDLSHEAAVGKIAEEEVEYLMARGLSRAQAVAAIVRGFLRVDIEGLPSQLERELQRAVEMSEKELL